MSLNTPENDHYCSITIGEITLSVGIVDGKIWLSKHSGEGGDFSIKEIEAILLKYYNENF